MKRNIEKLIKEATDLLTAHPHRDFIASDIQAIYDLSIGNRDGRMTPSVYDCIVIGLEVGYALGYRHGRKDAK